MEIDVQTRPLFVGETISRGSMSTRPRSEIAQHEAREAFSIHTRNLRVHRELHVLRDVWDHAASTNGAGIRAETPFALTA
jgi:hypothetical protein